MKLSRREMAKVLGASSVAAAGWESAVAEQEETGSVSTETVRALLNTQGNPSIYDAPEQLEYLVEAVNSYIRVQKIVREYPIPEDQQPAISLRRD